MDNLYVEIFEYTYNHKVISIRQIQMKFRIGYNRTLQIIKFLEQSKVIELIKNNYRVKTYDNI